MDAVVRSGNAQTAPRWLGLIFGFVGMAALAGAFFLARKQFTILHDWPQVEGEVLSSEITSHSSSDDNSTTYGLLVTFRYEYAGETHEASATRGYTTSSYNSMKRAAENFFPNTRHLIHVNPQRPQDIRFNAGYTFEFFGVSIFVAIFGFVFLLVSLLVFRGTAHKYSAAFAARDPDACPTCGTKPPPGEKFCPQCGTMLHSH